MHSTNTENEHTNHHIFITIFQQRHSNIYLYDYVYRSRMSYDKEYILF